MRLSSSVALLVLTLHLRTADAFSFAPSTTLRTTSSGSTITSRLYSSNEKAVREELKEKASLVDAESEINYSDGILVEEEENDEGASTAVKREITSDLSKKIERTMRPRAYPLFLAEKGANLLDDVISSVRGPKEEAPTGGFVNPSLPPPPTKEKIVILGTGWGAASFLKEIDNSKFDVTVISPRNHFLFTPMLAGASVGTVEYRSITESIREVRNIRVYLICVHITYTRVTFRMV